MDGTTPEADHLHEIATLRGEAPPAEAWRPSFNPWLIAVSVMSATFMEVLDTSVANVALPHIAGSLSASTDEATWVLTSYLVSNAIILPSTAWLTSRFGRRRLLIACIVIFTVASGLCGAAVSLPMLIVARVLQGAGGGVLQPIAQAVLLESFPPRQRGPAMAAYGVGVIVAPIIGPTLGGWITDNYSWRWCFYINLPVGVIAVLMTRAFIEDPPYLRPKGRVRMDYLGFSLMAVGLAALQIMLDKGQEEDWFQSGLIRWLAVLTAVGLGAFVAWEFITANPIVDLKIFANRNFATGTLLIGLVGAVLYGSTALLPLFLQTLLGYSALQSGLAVSPRGFGALVGMLVVGRLIGRLDARLLLAGGFAVLAYANYQFAGLNLNIAPRNITLPNIVSGFAMGLIFVPLTTTTMGTLPNEQVRNATGIYNLMRNIGGSLGIAAVTSMVSRGQQVHQTILAAHTTPASHELQNFLQRTTAALATRSGPVQAARQAYGVVYRVFTEQARLAAFIDDFRRMSLLCLLCLPGVFLFRKVRAQRGAVAAD